MSNTKTKAPKRVAGRAPKTSGKPKPAHKPTRYDPGVRPKPPPGAGNVFSVDRDQLKSLVELAEKNGDLKADQHGCWQSELAHRKSMWLSQGYQVVKRTDGIGDDYRLNEMILAWIPRDHFEYKQDQAAWASARQIDSVNEDVNDGAGTNVGVQDIDENEWEDLGLD